MYHNQQLQVTALKINNYFARDYLEEIKLNAKTFSKEKILDNVDKALKILDEQI